MHHKTRVVIIVSVEPVVLRRTRVEVTHHHPITALRLRRRKYRVTAHILHLHETVTVAAVFGLARITIRGTVGIGLRPRVQRDDIYLAAAALYTRMTRTVRHHAVGLLTDDVEHLLDRILRRDHLRIVVPVSALCPVRVSVPGCQLAPIIRQITILRSAGLVRAVLVYGLSLTPYTHIGIVTLDPLHKVIVVVALIGPHAVLDIPIQYTQRRLLAAAAVQNDNCRHDSRGRHKQHPTKYSDQDSAFHITCP